MLRSSPAGRTLRGARRRAQEAKEGPLRAVVARIQHRAFVGNRDTPTPIPGASAGWPASDSRIGLARTRRCNRERFEHVAPGGYACTVDVGTRAHPGDDVVRTVKRKRG